MITDCNVKAIMSLCRDAKRWDTPRIISYKRMNGGVHTFKLTHDTTLHFGYSVYIWEHLRYVLVGKYHCPKHVFSNVARKCGVCQLITDGDKGESK